MGIHAICNFISWGSVKYPLSSSPATAYQLSVSRKSTINYLTHSVMKINVSIITQHHTELCKHITAYWQMVVLQPSFVWPPISLDYSALNKSLLNHCCQLSPWGTIFVITLYFFSLLPYLKMKTVTKVVFHKIFHLLIFF